MIRTLTTYVGQASACRKAKAYLYKRAILSSWRTLRRGHHEFTLHLPTLLAKSFAEKMLAKAFGDTYYEPPRYSQRPDEIKPERPGEADAINRNLHIAPAGAKAIPGFREAQAREKAAKVDRAMSQLRSELLADKRNVEQCVAISEFLATASDSTKATLFDILRR